MFERYTEKARRVIFFARYEASQFGGTNIETEHLLLGLLREDAALTNRHLRSLASVEAIRQRIEKHTPPGEKVSTSVDLPLSLESTRILAYAAEEAERLGHKHIGTEHLLLGILREDKSFAAIILRERGLRLSTLRQELSKVQSEMPASQESWQPVVFGRDMTQAAKEKQLGPLIGREREVERLVQILGRRAKNNPVLVGGAGVGKTAIVEGLASRIADGNVAPFLAEKRVLAVDLSSLVAGIGATRQFEERVKTLTKELTEARNTILVIEDLSALAGVGAAEGALIAAEIWKPAIARGELQCIGAMTPQQYQKSIEWDRWVERYFWVVKVEPPSEADAIHVLFAMKDRYERFHNVTYTEDSLKYAVYCSNRFVLDRALPDKALDVLDEAGTCVKLRQSVLPEEMIDVQKRLRFVSDRMENAIANHEFEKGRFYSDEERKERENLRLLREKYKIDDTVVSTVTREDVEEIVARWTGVPVSTIRQQSS